MLYMIILIKLEQKLIITFAMLTVLYLQIYLSSRHTMYNSNIIICVIIFCVID